MHGSIKAQNDELRQAGTLQLTIRGSRASGASQSCMFALNSLAQPTMSAAISRAELTDRFKRLRSWPGLIEAGCLALLVTLHAARAEGKLHAVPVLTLEPIYRSLATNSAEHLCTREQAALRNLKPATVAFLAINSAEWPERLTPLFAMEMDGQFELRRRPRIGQENFTDPLFFALPPEHEPDSVKIAGRWECVATHADRSKNYFAIELAVEGEHLAGRFDQNTDYRIASVSGGRFCSNRIELTVEHVMDRYTLAGDWRNGTISGAWKRADDADHGTWAATRPPPRARLVQPSAAVPLYEWRRTADGTRRYSIETDLGEPGWERASQPLCRVWRPGSIESRHPKQE